MSLAFLRALRRDRFFQLLIIVGDGVKPVCSFCAPRLAWRD
ncbi:membrane protein [Salmonella enterica subsp. enterica]|nr:membrane protein [Salmonella enterica subsp. enterica]SUH20727.1 membrane protein [Salmonella enterica subsp. enterica]